MTKIYSFEFKRDTETRVVKVKAETFVVAHAKFLSKYPDDDIVSVWASQEEETID